MARNAVDYEQDFVEWTQEQARLLRSGEFSQVDAENLAEEIESLGRRDRRELTRRFEKLIAELLKWHLHAGARCGNWRSEILQQRYEIELVLEDSPSLRQTIAERLPKLYSDARERIVEELGLLQPTFPESCPFTPEQLLAEDFLPEG